MRGEQAIFNLEIKKKSGLSLNPDIHHSKVFSYEVINTLCSAETWRATEKQLFLKNYTRTEYCEFSDYNFENFLWFW